MEEDPAGRSPAQGLQLRGRISGGGLQCFEWCPPSSCPLAPGNVTLFGNSIFAAVIKVKILRWDDFRFRVGPTSTDWCPFQKRHTHTHRRSYVRTEQRQVTATSQTSRGLQETFLKYFKITSFKTKTRWCIAQGCPRPHDTSMQR